MPGKPDAGSPFHLTPIAHELWVEGRRDGVEFRGRAHALRVTAAYEAAEGETAYLVDAADDGGPDGGPFWVPLADVTALEAADDRAPDHEGLPAVLGYVHPQAADPAADARALREFCMDRDWSLLDVVGDVGEALDRIAEDEADGLVVPRLEQLAASPADLAPFLDWFLATDTVLAIADVGLDTSVAGGRAAATALAHLTAWRGNAPERSPARPAANDDRHADGDGVVIDLAEHRRRAAGGS